MRLWAVEWRGAVLCTVGGEAVRCALWVGVAVGLWVEEQGGQFIGFLQSKVVIEIHVMTVLLSTTQGSGILMRNRTQPCARTHVWGVTTRAVIP